MSESGDLYSSGHTFPHVHVQNAAAGERYAIRSGIIFAGARAFLQTATNLNPSVVGTTIATNSAPTNGFIQLTETKGAERSRFLRLVFP